MVDTDSNCEERIPMFHDAGVYMMLGCILLVFFHTKCKIIKGAQLIFELRACFFVKKKPAYAEVFDICR